MLKCDKNIQIRKKISRSEEVFKSYSSIKLLPKNNISIYNDEEALTKKN